MNRGSALSAGAVCILALLQFSVDAQAYDILDRVPPAPPPPAQSTPYPWLQGLRLEAGVGYNTGTRDMKISSPGIGSLSSNLVGGDGVAAEGAVWLDTLLPAVPNVSIGAQYLHLDSGGSVTATSGVGPIFGLTSATAKLSQTTDALMFNAAWRPGFGFLHPFVGAGVGVAFSELSASALGLSPSQTQTAVAGQVFAGLDYDIGANVYAGVAGRFFISETTYRPGGFTVPVEIDVTNRPISLMGHLGVRF